MYHSVSFVYIWPHRHLLPAVAARRFDAVGEEVPVIAVGRLENGESIVPYADYVYILCYTGFRPNELLQMEESAYDPARQSLTGGFKTEAGTNRVVTLSPKIQPLVAALAEKASPYIFPRPDGKMMKDDCFRKFCFNPLMESLGIKDRVPYSCRHTFSNLIKKIRGSNTDKAALMGHSDTSMTEYYQSADYESLKEITDQI